MISIKVVNVIHQVVIGGKNKLSYRATDPEIKSLMLDPAKGVLITDNQNRSYFIPVTNITQCWLEDANLESKPNKKNPATSE